MWIVGFDTTYYPCIYTFEKREDALLKYKRLKEILDQNEGVFIAKVESFDIGKDYCLFENLDA